MKFWLVTLNGVHVICNSRTREFAKSKAHSCLGGNPDTYVVTPLTDAGERVNLDVTVK